MFVTSLSYQNKQTGWILQNLSLDKFNLLVGASGVGKTQILRAIREIQSLAMTGQPSIPIKFKIEFNHKDKNFEWAFESTIKENAYEASPRIQSAPAVIVVQEKLTVNFNSVLVDRNQDTFLFSGKELPQLNRSETALKLIDEPPVFSIRAAVVDGILDDHPYQASYLFTDTGESLLKTLQNMARWEDTPTLPPHFKAYLLQNRSPGKFKSLKSIFMEIFPSVEDVSVELTTQHTERQIQFKFKEHGIKNWVPASDISSGMIRTLIHLVDLTTVPNDSLVLIDEFENSLGVNCMGPLTDFILSRSSELQFIITSHHPYIINKIPKTHWKVVRRHGSTVQVTPAKEMRALQGASAQDEFTRLINAPEFEEGIA